MRVMSKFTRNLVMTVLVFAGILALTVNPGNSSAGISIESYCQLAMQSMQQEVSNFRDLIEIARRYRSAPETLAQQEKVKQIQFDQARRYLFSSFGTSAEEYVTYMGKNGVAVKRYLEANPDINQRIDDLSAQVNSLMQEYESLKGGSGPPPPPVR